MNKNIFTQSNPVATAFVASSLAMAVVLSSFAMFEPSVVLGQVEDEFTVRQEITGEISFETIANNVIMAPTIAGLTGGISSGTTTVAVSTNSPTGYEMTIRFADPTAMQYEGGAAEIPNFGAGTPERLFTVATGEAAFAFTASSTSVVNALRDTGAACGSGNSTSDTCWVMPVNATSSYTIVDRATETTSAGEFTDLTFRVGVGANPIPTLPVGFYTATATLTAVET